MEPVGAEITAGEIAAVCAQYNLGVVEQVRAMARRGGRRSSGGGRRTGGAGGGGGVAGMGGMGGALAVLRSDSGVYLLKRRAASQADPRRVALSHQVQLHLQAAGYPVPALVGTRGANNSMVQIADRVYEVFRFVPGAAYDGSEAATLAAGRALGWYHRCLLNLVPAWDPPTASFHSSASLPSRLEGAVRSSQSPATTPADRAAARRLAGAYAAAAQEAERLGVRSLPRQIVHGDWHPGNVLFRIGEGSGGSGGGGEGAEVAAVVDHDTVALWPRVFDVAYGALHFSLPRMRLAGSPERPLTQRGLTPQDHADEGRLAAFCRGYHDGSTAPLTGPEAAALPWLMIEAMVADAAAAWAGLSSPSPGGEAGVERASTGGFLDLIARKTAWLAASADRIARIAAAGGG